MADDPADTGLPPGDAPDPDATDAALPTDAPAEALTRARASARAKGLRPGMKPARGPRPGASEQTGAKRRDPVLLGVQVDNLVADREWEQEVAVGGIIGRWPQIVGPEIAQHCGPTDFTDGVLTLRADSTAWATQLRLLSSSLLARLAAEVGDETVRELRVVGPSAPSWSRGALRVSGGRGPRDTYG